MTAQPEAEFDDFIDPAFRDKVAAYIAKDDVTFAEWLKESDLGAHVDLALQAGKAAFTAAAMLPEEENPRWTLATIPLDHRRAQPLVRALASRGVGQTEIMAYTWEVGVAHIMGKRKRAATSAQAHATVEAFALALSKPGFELQIWRE